MRIAQIASVIESVPPKKYGGTERVVYALTEELVKKGHQVTLFASGDSVTSAKLISVTPKSLRELGIDNVYGPNNYCTLNVGLAYKMQREFDIIHDHTGPISFPAANIASTPVVMTLHGPITPSNKRLFELLRKPNLVTISKAQAEPAPNLNYAGNVYNGLSMADYPFGAKDKGYLLFVGRISPEKGVHHAIKVAQYLGLPLIIAAKLEVNSTKDVAYFHDQIEPFLCDQIKWIGEVDEATRNKLMSQALAFLHPITWAEPFGLTLIEAMACGCPVVAIGLGSIPEIIKNGQTGFVVDDVDQMIQAVANVGMIDRRYCREYAINTFSAKRMADGYEALYTKLVQKPATKPSTISQTQLGFTQAYAHNLRETED